MNLRPDRLKKGTPSSRGKTQPNSPPPLGQGPLSIQQAKYYYLPAERSVGRLLLFYLFFIIAANVFVCIDIKKCNDYLLHIF